MASDNTPVEGKVAVEDRHEAWPFRPSPYTDDRLTREKWMDGVYDKIPVIQAFARHRQASPDGERLRGLLVAICAAQDIAPYRGWNLSALNKATADARAYLGLPSVRDLNPDIAAMQDNAVANKDAIRAALKGGEQ